MSFYKVPITQITGLSTSGTADSAGTWNTGVDLDSFVTVPSGATGVIVAIQNTSSSLRWAGLRTTGKTTPVLLADFQINSAIQHRIVPLGAGNQIDLYLEGATVTFYILGFTASDFTFFDIDGTLPSIASTSGVTSTVAAPADVTGAVAILTHNFVGGWSPTGEVALIATTAGSASPNSLLMQVDGSRELRLNTNATTSILGYTTAGVTWNAWLGNAEDVTADGTWRDGESSNGAAKLAHIQWTGFSAAQGFSVREDGVTTPSGAPLVAYGMGFYAPLSSLGAYEYLAESTFTGSPYVVAWLSEPVAAGATQITAVSDATPYHGQTSITVTGTNFNAAQGDGEIYVCSANDPDDLSAVNQTVTAWGDTEITITAVLDSFDFDTDLYLFVRNSDEEEDTTGFVIQRSAVISITKTLETKAQAAQANITDINWAVYEDVTLETLLQRGTGESTDGSGQIVINLTTQGGLDANAADPVYLILSKDGAVGSELFGAVKVVPTYA